MSEERAPITFHLEELRRRIIVCLVAWLVGSIISYIYAEDIIAVISAPAGKLYFLNPAEVFFSYIEIAAFAGFIGTLPIHCFEFWRFLRPALRGGEVKTALWFIPSALLLFYGGSAFAFFFVLPAAVQFFMDFATAVRCSPMFLLSAYLSFFFAFLLPFALGFELPFGPAGPVPPGPGDGGHAEGQAPRLRYPGLHLCRCRVADDGYVYADLYCRSHDCLI
jgi:sec-independent protein translocase protein TatC